MFSARTTNKSRCLTWRLDLWMLSSFLCGTKVLGNKKRSPFLCLALWVKHQDINRSPFDERERRAPQTTSGDSLDLMTGWLFLVSAAKMGQFSIRKHRACSLELWGNLTAAGENADLTQTAEAKTKKTQGTCAKISRRDREQTERRSGLYVSSLGFEGLLLAVPALILQLLQLFQDSSGLVGSVDQHAQQLEAQTGSKWRTQNKQKYFLV